MMTAEPRLRPKIILASASPRRLDLLRQAGLEPDLIVPTDCDETPQKNELPSALALRLAQSKRDSLRPSPSDAYVIAADTVVGVGRRILPKAETAADVMACLELLSGRRHRVYTGLALRAPDGRLASRLVTTIVKFKRLSLHEMQAYVVSGEGLGKAGGYAIQGRAALMIAEIHGSYSNVVGLPLYELGQMLNGLGHPLWTA